MKNCRQWGRVWKHGKNEDVIYERSHNEISIEKYFVYFIYSVLSVACLHNTIVRDRSQSMSGNTYKIQFAKGPP